MKKTSRLKYYISIARPDHWIKNFFIFPGVIIAGYLSSTSVVNYFWKIIIGFISVCLIASANYVINEWLDVEFDKFHPVKKMRPSVVNNLNPKIIYLEYAILAFIGLFIATKVSLLFTYASIFLLVMGILYNVKPIRTKDVVYLDVISESINNAIRLAMGWFIVTSDILPPSSLIIGYWMGGAFLMAVKRYAEYRFIGDKAVAGLYRRSFVYYTEHSLLVSAFFYGISSTFFIGVFLIKYRVELLLGIPFLALLFSWYLYIGLQENSAAQHPELLYKEKKFLLYMLFLAGLFFILIVIDIPQLNWFLSNDFINPIIR
jgi:decaprenyl-phosphate phosphoribosyltransferase